MRCGEPPPGVTVRSAQLLTAGVWTPERIAAAMNGTRTVRISVSPPIPVFIFCTTAIVRADETVEFFDDIYGLDAPLDRALAAAEHR